VHEHIGVAVAIEPQAFWMLQLHPTKNQGPAWDKPMDVVSVADTQLH